MQKIFLITLLIVYRLMMWGQQAPELINTKLSLDVDTFYSTYRIEDKYRWMEDVHSVDTKDWLNAQNKVCNNYLSKVSGKINSFNSIDTYTYTEFDNPQKMGKYYFFTAYYNNFGVPALYMKTSLKDVAQKLVDPVFISAKDQIRIGGYSVSKDSKLLAYSFSRNGSDWKEVKVVSTLHGENLKDHLKELKSSKLAWLGDGFFYSTFSQDQQFGETNGQRVFYHKIGTEQQDDKLIFEKKNNLTATFDYLTTSDERYFILKDVNQLTGKSNIFYIDYQSEHPELKPLLTNIRFGIHFLDSHDGKFIASTMKDSNNGSIVEIDPLNPLKWREIVPEFTESMLLKVIPFEDRIVAEYISNQHPIITVFDYSGAVLYNQKFPAATSISGFSGESTDEELLFSFNSYTIPPVVYQFNIKTFKSELTQQTAVTFDWKTIEYKEVEYLNKDSILVPMVLVYNKGIKMDGSNPTILEAYGGFGVVTQPTFDPGIVYFIKHGGIYAFANIRGGGDKGKEWAREGRGLKKQNSFDDFIAAAEYLIRTKYTSPEKLASTGASNGGLVVAATAIQRPDLFRAVVPVVAPLDMLRLEKFTVGHWNVDEYGSVKDSLSFTKLLGYSPYYNVKEGVNYPSMLVVTSDHDDRVPPYNSYKFVARLQSRSAQKNPVLLKVEKDSGHNGASTLTSWVKEMADIYGFIMYELTKKQPVLNFLSSACN